MEAAPATREEKSRSQTIRRQQHRESVESFVIVVVAFLVWSIEAEGFVIPTGSMATTLMGRHKEIVCPECGNVYSVNADCEVDSSGSGVATGRAWSGERVRTAGSRPGWTTLPAFREIASTR